MIGGWELATEAGRQAQLRRLRAADARRTERRGRDARESSAIEFLECGVCGEPAAVTSFCPTCGGDVHRVEYDDTPVHTGPTLRDALILAGIGLAVIGPFVLAAFAFYVRLNGWPW